uniref:Uncharacterized protein n=1 Tax=Anguilla anguilla TaxID=7936 RepID=A0A0E9RRH6_ANGAN
MILTVTRKNGLLSGKAFTQGQLWPVQNKVDYEWCMDRPFARTQKHINEKLLLFVEMSQYMFIRTV